MWKRHAPSAFAAALLLAINSFGAFAQEAELLEVLRSDASVEEKSAACRQLSRIATKESVPTLASLLGDETLSHMARYALEPIADPAVDEALRQALDTVSGRPRLGVIGSLGVRRDTKAVDPLAKLLDDVECAAAAARALGSIGTPDAAQTLQTALPEATAEQRLAVCDGLFRCAETLAAEGQQEASEAIYDGLRTSGDLPPQVRAAALRGAILARGKMGVPLIVEAIRGPEYAMAAAAARAAMESPEAEIADALVAELPELPAERQGLLMLALADRGDSRILPVVLQAAKRGDDQLRILAFRALKRVGDPSSIPALLEAAVDGSEAVSAAAIESLETLQDKSVDELIVARLPKAKGKLQSVLIDLATRRRTEAAAGALWEAADAKDPAIRVAALAGLGAVLKTNDLPRLLARLSETSDDREAAALDEAIREVGLRAEDREAVASRLAAVLPEVDAPVKARILETLNVIGGTTALATVAAAARSDDEPLQDAASRVLGRWKSADAAPVLLDLYNALNNNRLKIRAIRAYIRIARQFDMPAAQRAAMCRRALELAERDEDKRLVLEVLLRYPSDEMRSIAMRAAEVPALKEQAMLVLMGMASKGIDRAELGRALAQAGQKPVELEIVEAEYGAGDKTKDVTAELRKYAKNYRIIFLPSTTYNESFGGDPAPGIVKKLRIRYRVNGKEGEVTLSENATIVLPMPK